MRCSTTANKGPIGLFAASRLTGSSGACGKLSNPLLLVTSSAYAYPSFVVSAVFAAYSRKRHVEGNRAGRMENPCWLALIWSSPLSIIS